MLWELITWSPDGKSYGLKTKLIRSTINSLKEIIFGDQSG